MNWEVLVSGQWNSPKNNIKSLLISFKDNGIKIPMIHAWLLVEPMIFLTRDDDG